ncbi:sensor histidine kinase [Pectinatus haikarae]|uniref:histidine kinase n=1 Tax=Pectinatus haikarae TaxID=349096 RepID=A0ABT9Y6Y0_9FIRM|nr:HAMP domain-containing sensor histidine kinase [Pectinatus haikarae]MDQ0203573.1 two-component system sensor histidine kinase BaeS [Pectinatus haikarae]
MSRFNSITVRITGLTFVAIAVTVFVLIYLADVQMEEQFKEYLIVQQIQMQGGNMYDSEHTMALVMGPTEKTFLMSVHNSLFWVGLIMLLLGLLVSYLLARSITVPLKNLGQAAKEVKKGTFGKTVSVRTNDEVGELADIFNQMSQTLADNTRLKKQLLANVAHELRTPLAVIQGNIEGMLDGVVEPSKDQLRSLYEEAIRLNRLIRDLRDLSLAEVHQLTLEKSPADINNLINRLIASLKPLSNKKNITINFTNGKEKLPDILVDRDRISQVFYNVIVNAVRYSPECSTIQIKTALLNKQEGRWVKISIADNGTGISKEDLPHVFDHFYRGDKSRDRKSGGSGLGLAIVRQLIENHGGKIEVTSTIGMGTTFNILLPLN